MCIEDIAIARKTYTKETALPSGAGLQLAANPDRLAVRITVRGSITNRAGIALDAAGASSGNYLVMGYIVNNGTADAAAEVQCELNYRRDMALVMGKLWARSESVDGVLIETLMMTELSSAVTKKGKELVNANGK